MYGSNQVLDQINITIYKGDVYGFIGKNGAGKTTFIRTITKMISKTSGEFVFLNPDIKISAVIEQPALYMDMTAMQNLTYMCKLKNCGKKEWIEEVLAFVGLENTGKKLVRDFSLGMRQRLGIGLAIITRPDFLILDEPINGLDPVGIVEIRNIIRKINKEIGTTILISSHILSELEMVATRYGIIHHGKMVREFTKEELMKETGKFALLQTSDNQKAWGIIKEYHANDVTLDGEYLVFNATDECCRQISRKLLQEEIAVYQFQLKKIDLEEYFLNLVEENK
ncbi:MAG: ATP-binding cassette domain-containing protein [Lachnospiraceae bacterium]|nr:ATP-binding cassette domain-containing protein [Lachnospiraceae bacterium]